MHAVGGVRAERRQLWSRIRAGFGHFIHALWRQGALEGRSPTGGHFVRCDWDAMTQDDIDGGIVNIVVGFAPLTPAEFVIFRIRQMIRPT